MQVCDLYPQKWCWEGGGGRQNTPTPPHRWAGGGEFKYCSTALSLSSGQGSWEVAGGCNVSTHSVEHECIQ